MDNLRFERPGMDAEEFVSGLDQLSLSSAGQVESHGQEYEIYVYLSKYGSSSILVVFDISVPDRVVVEVDRKYADKSEGFGEEVSYQGALGLIRIARQAISE